VLQLTGREEKNKTDKSLSHLINEFIFTDFLIILNFIQNQESK
jgi:hypothetical protein